jgi:hypothetical protein
VLTPDAIVGDIVLEVLPIADAVTPVIVIPSVIVTPFVIVIAIVNIYQNLTFDFTDMRF